jgi:hypothetical protein
MLRWRDKVEEDLREKGWRREEGMEGKEKGG